jgi:hypothetical protein
MTASTKRVLNRARLPDFLQELRHNTGEEPFTLYQIPGSLTTEPDNDLKALPVEKEIYQEITGLADRSPTGAVIFYSPGRTCLLLPPFPIKEKFAGPGVITAPLESLVLADYLIALILVRLGSYAVGVCRGGQIISSKVGTGLVHGRHKKGGSSAHRFERHRDKQIEYFLTRVCQRTREHLEPHEKSLDFLVYGGARTTVQLLQKQCGFVAKLETPALTPLYDIPEPRQAVLESAINRVWSSTVIEWREEHD